MANYPPRRQRTVAREATIDLNRVHAFVRVVEDGSFTAAARKLGLPKSSVSRTITALEKSLGVRLLQRTTRALHLTEAGRTWFQEVQPALASLTDSAAAVMTLGTEPRGRVRITCPPDSGDLMLPFVKAFQKRYPRVEVDVSFSARHADLVAEGFDLALRAGELKDSSLVVKKLRSTDLALYASPAYLKRAGTPRSLGELARHACIGMNAANGRTLWALTGPNGELENVEVRCSLSTDLVTFAASAAIDGLGIALLPDICTSDELVRVLPGYRRTGVGLNLVSPSRGFEPRAVTLFKQELAQYILDSVKGCQQAALRGGRRSG